MLTFEELEKLVAAIASGRIPDDRPGWLLDMPSARDNTAYYYPFFYQLAKRGPFKMLEIGTYLGTSSAHMAYGAKVGKGGQVYTIDVNPGATQCAEEVARAADLELTPVTGDALAIAKSFKPFGPFDILFIDSNHNFNQAYSEYVQYRPLVRDGGAIFFDDISLDMANCEMDVLWEFIVDPKRRLDPLHYTGFGVATKDPAVRPPSLNVVMADSMKRMAELGAQKAAKR